jgi:hypothetical protein
MFERGQRYFIDSNIFLYAAGQHSYFKDQCLGLLNELAANEAIAVTNTAVLEEVHYVYFRQTRKMKECIQLLKNIQAGLGEILPMTEEVIQIAWSLSIQSKKKVTSVKDFYHAASMIFFRIKNLLSYDTDFDSIPGINRIPF